MACTDTDGLGFVGEAIYQVGPNAGLQEPKEKQSSSDQAFNRSTQGEAMFDAYETTKIWNSALHSCSVECRNLTVEVQARDQTPLSLYSVAARLADLAHWGHQLLGGA